MDFKLTSGNYDIVSTNRVFSYGKEEQLLISIKTDKEFNFSLNILFMTTEVKDSNNILIENENNILTIKLYNFNNAFGTGTKQPIEIATIDNRKMYLMLWSFLPAENVRLIDYTIFLAKGIMK